MARQLSGRAPPDHGVAMRPVMNSTYSVALYRPWKRACTAPSLRQPTCSLWPPWLRPAPARLKAASRAGREPRLGRADAVGPRLAGTAVACRRCTPRHGERSRHRSRKSLCQAMTKICCSGLSWIFDGLEGFHNDSQGALPAGRNPGRVEVSGARGARRDRQRRLSKVIVPRPRAPVKDAGPTFEYCSPEKTERPPGEERPCQRGFRFVRGF